MSKSEALAHGGEIKDENGNILVFTLPNEDGGTTWVRLELANGSQQYLCIIEEAGLVKQLKFGPAEMKDALDKDGRISLHGILFDLDKCTLKQKSNKQLQDVLVLLKDNPDLRLEVQGHTDDQGSDDYNMALSQQRSEAVVRYLELFGIESSRLTPKGYGESKPVETNATEEGRAQNRRVELVRQ